MSPAMFPRTRPGRIAGIVVVLAVAAAGYAWHQAREGDSGPRYRTVRVERGPLQAVVAASGTLNAVSTVQVRSQISGQVQEIYADFNTAVKQGQILARIDPSTYELRVNQARADLDAANSAVAVARSQLEAQVAEAERLKKLRGATRSKLGAIRGQIRISEAQVGSALATVKQREAQLKQAQADLERTDIRAPVDGTVILRNVDAGQTVAVSPQAPALFVIAQDLRDMQVEAAVDHADLGRPPRGPSTTFTVDAVPPPRLPGESEFPIREYVAVGREVGYEGPWGIEVLNLAARSWPLEKLVPTALMAGVRASSMIARGSTFRATAASTAARISFIRP